MWTMPLHQNVNQKSDYDDDLYSLCCARIVFYYLIPFKGLLLKVFNLLQFVKYVYSTIATIVDSSGISSLSILFACVLFDWHSYKI